KYHVETVHNKYTMSLYTNYESAKEGELFLIEGSSNTLEISLKNGNANKQLGVKTGEKIKIL
ncbi:unnamed protein product, partial [marine sediment metagenome]